MLRGEICILLLFCRITDPLLHRYWRKQGLGTVASKLLVSDGSAESVAVLFLEFTFLQLFCMVFKYQQLN